MRARRPGKGVLVTELQEQLTQLSQLQSHCELLSGTAAPKPRQRNDAELSELDENGGAVVAADATAPASEMVSSAPADAPTADESPPAAIPDELPGLARELHSYERVVNGALQVRPEAWDAGGPACACNMGRGIRCGIAGRPCPCHAGLGC